ncbi:MAG TPA: hypothetical protein VGR76_04290 [Candidatus Angelobacter sp.]|nr:hypothetical protein [Candidatus Angelobacter sp.]
MNSALLRNCAEFEPALWRLDSSNGMYDEGKPVHGVLIEAF